MPESREKEAHAKMMKKVFDRLKSEGYDFRLLGIWVDGTEKEQKAARAGTRLKQGQVYKIESSSKIKRGSRSNQSLVFPYMYAPKPKRGRQRAAPPPPLPLDDLVLEDMESGPRSIILKFTNALCQVCS